MLCLFNLSAFKSLFNGLFTRRLKIKKKTLKTLNAQRKDEILGFKYGCMVK